MFVLRQWGLRRLLGRHGGWPRDDKIRISLTDLLSLIEALKILKERGPLFKSSDGSYNLSSYPN